VNNSSVRPGQLWWLAAGFAVWCSALAALYAVHAIGCAFGWSALLLRLSLGAVFLAHLAVIGWMWRSLDGADSASGFGATRIFLHTTVVWTTAAAFITTVLTLGPPLLLSVCM
jgi:hypothetical protein